MNKEKSRLIIAIILLIICAFEFFYLTPFGIKIGYMINGGSKSKEEQVNKSELLREYEEMVNTYNLYKDGVNMISLQWAENARIKANEIANTYNEIMNEKILEIIGEEK